MVLQPQPIYIIPIKAVKPVVVGHVVRLAVVGMEVAKFGAVVNIDKPFGGKNHPSIG